MKRYDHVEQLWRELREGSPAPDLMAEGRIVAAGALADQGDLKGALKPMERGADVPKKVRDITFVSGMCSAICTTAPATSSRLAASSA